VKIGKDNCVVTGIAHSKRGVY